MGVTVDHLSDFGSTVFWQNSLVTALFILPVLNSLSTDDYGKKVNSFMDDSCTLDN